MSDTRKRLITPITAALFALAFAAAAFAQQRYNTSSGNFAPGAVQMCLANDGTAVPVSSPQRRWWCRVRCGRSSAR